MANPRLRTQARLSVLAQEANVDEAVADRWRKGLPGVTAYTSDKLARAARRLTPGSDERAARASLARQGTALLVLMDGQTTAGHVAKVCGASLQSAQAMLAELATLGLASYHAPLWQLVDREAAEERIEQAAHVVLDIEQTMAANRRGLREPS
jgi:hypothetical protein